MRRSAPRKPGGVVRRFAWIAFLAVGCIAAVVYALEISELASAISSVTVGVGALFALLVGPKWHNAQPRRPWNLLAATGALFLVGILVRPWASEQTGIGVFASDLFTVPGYICMILGLAGLIRARGRLERHAITDGLIVTTGAALLSILLLAAPAAELDRAPGVSVMAAIYPLFDVILVLLLANLAFTTAARQPSFLLLVAMMTLLLGGDVAYAIVGVSGFLFVSPLMDVPFLLGFTMIGAAALHPSMTELGRARPMPAQPWSWQRLLVIVPAVAVPFVLVSYIDNGSIRDRVILAVGGLSIMGLLLFRAVAAVQALAAAQRRAEYQATHDELTGLPNRAMLSAEVDRLLRASTVPTHQIWVLFLDLDGFKLVNDSWGHAAGDQLIAEVAGRLRRAVPESATVARVGGDEFLIVHVCEEADALELAERLLDTFSEPLQMRTAEVVISASVGIAGVSVNPTVPTSAEALMRDADTAMYQAKSEGPGKATMFDASMHERVRERMEIELALRHALVQRELHLVYQPIVDLRTNRMVGAEALARWEHPQRGTIPPTTFIPIAEDAGLITRFGRWVLDESLAQVARWRKDGVITDDFWISINVSPRQLRDASLPNVVTESLVRHGVPPGSVVLEITESVMIDPSAVTDQVLFDLRSLGIRIVVDDFGTGYSALGYLRRHPVTGVKIDRAFVQELGGDSEDEEIVRAVVALSGAMGLTVVAEGVETDVHQSVLASLGVVYGQGMLWGLGVRPAEFAQRWSVVGAEHPVVQPARVGGGPGWNGTDSDPDQDRAGGS